MSRPTASTYPHATNASIPRDAEVWYKKKVCIKRRAPRLQGGIPLLKDNNTILKPSSQCVYCPHATNASIPRDAQKVGDKMIVSKESIAPQKPFQMTWRIVISLHLFNQKGPPTKPGSLTTLCWYSEILDLCATNFEHQNSNHRHMAFFYFSCL